MKPLIQAKGLVKRYGNRTVVKGIDLIIQRGEVIGIVGPNGAGKSTTLEMILGLRKPDQGTVHYWSPDPRKHMGVQLQSTPFFPGLTCMENLQLFASFYGLKLTSGQIDEILEQCDLVKVKRTEASRISGGQQKRLAIAMALTHKPDLVFLDEPTAALDPRARHEIRQLIQSLAQSGTTIVFTSHDLEEVEKIATRVCFIYQGQVQASDTIENLLQKYQQSSLEELYLQFTSERSASL